MLDVIVIGAGIMGATIAQAFRNYGPGRDVLVLDGDYPLSGTKASGGSIKPSKLAGLDADMERVSLDMLDALWGLKKEIFEVRPAGKWLKTAVWRINMDLVNGIDKTLARVRSVHVEGRFNNGKPTVELVGGELLTCKLLIVAAGMGCSTLFPKLKMSGKMGVSFKFKGELPNAFVKAWAPYKQITIHPYDYQGEEVIWGGDGTAIKPENWTQERADISLARVGRELEGCHWIDTTLGIRPFVDGSPKPCFLEEVYDNVWVATGGGKFGGLAAGWAAHELLRLG